MSSIPTRAPNGVSNLLPDNLLASYPALFPYKGICEWGTDFDRYRAADWTVTVVGTGTAALANGAGGILALTTSAGATDAVYLDKVGENWQAQVGYRLWFKGRFQVSDATNTELVGGLQTTDTSPIAVTDGIYFHKPSAGTRLYLVQISASTGLTTTTDTGVNIANSTYAAAGFYYDGQGNLKWAVYDSTDTVVAQGTVAANLPAVTLTESFGILNAAAAAHTLDVDYVWTAQELPGR